MWRWSQYSSGVTRTLSHCAWVGGGITTPHLTSRGLHSGEGSPTLTSGLSRWGTGKEAEGTERKSLGSLSLLALPLRRDW